mmetsp:Transcript_54255/g.152804  ORF Transcript_54255/g.152804 Transcript_54255/m.152804 type:complete len:205 (+) Transcript_54255:249-863(+)
MARSSAFSIRHVLQTPVAGVDALRGLDICLRAVWGASPRTLIRSEPVSSRLSAEAWIVRLISERCRRMQALSDCNFMTSTVFASPLSCRQPRMNSDLCTTPVWSLSSNRKSVPAFWASILSVSNNATSCGLSSACEKTSNDTSPDLFRSSSSKIMSSFSMHFFFVWMMTSGRLEISACSPRITAVTVFSTTMTTKEMKKMNMAG